MAIARIRQQPALAVRPLIRELRTEPAPDAFWSVKINWWDGPKPLNTMAFNHREAAAWLLGELGPVAAPAVPELTASLQDSDPLLPPLAARALFRITRRSDAVLPTLITCLRSKDTKVNFLAILALREMGSAARPAIPALREVQTRSLEFRQCVRRALAEIGN